MDPDPRHPGTDPNPDPGKWYGSLQIWIYNTTRLSSLAVLPQPSCHPLSWSHYLVFTVMSWPSCPLCPVQGGRVKADLSQFFCSRYPILTVLSWLSCHGCPIPVVLYLLSSSGRPVLYSCPNCTILTGLFGCPFSNVLVQNSCPRCPVLAQSFPGWPVSTTSPDWPASVVLSQLPCPRYSVPTVLSFFCHTYPVPAVLFCLSCTLSCPGFTILTILLGCLVLAVLPQLSCPSCSAPAVLPQYYRPQHSFLLSPIIAVMFRLSCHIYSVPDGLSLQSCYDCFKSAVLAYLVVQGYAYMAEQKLKNK
jgi:hypothetical protein